MITKEQAAWLAQELADQAQEAATDIDPRGGAVSDEAARRRDMLAAGASHFAEIARA